jgi:hypothetical protein
VSGRNDFQIFHFSDSSFALRNFFKFFLCLFIQFIYNPTHCPNSESKKRCRCHGMLLLCATGVSIAVQKISLIEALKIFENYESAKTAQDKMNAFIF